MRGHHRVLGDVAEGSELRPGIVLQRLGRPAHEYIRDYSEPAQLLHCVLGRFGLLLSHRPHDRDQTDMDEADVLTPDPELKLAQSLDEGSALDISHRTAEFYDTDIGSAVVAIARHMRDPLDPLLDLIGDVRDDLHGLPEVVTTTLPFDHSRVDLACGDVVVPRQSDIQEPLVVTKVQVDFSPVIEHKDLSVLEWAHGPGIDVQVGVNLDRSDAQSRGFEQNSHATRSDSFA